MALLLTGLALGLLASWSNGFLTGEAQSERQVRFDSDSYALSEPAVFHVQDSMLSTAASCTATWDAIGAAVTAGTTWSLTTGQPHPSQFSLSKGRGYDRTSPAGTPLVLPVAAMVNGVGTFPADFVPSSGDIILATSVDLASGLAIDFTHERVDLYTAADRRASVHSPSDPDGEWVPLSEVVSDEDSAPSPTSGVFRGSVSLSLAPSTAAPGDGTMLVAHGDRLTVTYYEPGGETAIDTDGAPLELPSPTATSSPQPTATPTLTPTSTPTDAQAPIPTAVPTTSTPGATSTGTPSHTPSPTPRLVPAPVASPAATGTPGPDRTVTGTADAGTPAALAAARAGAASLECEFSLSAELVIKGNIGDGGVRIYHVPGGPYYSRTVIDESKGERWFCTVAEATEAGWRPPATASAALDPTETAVAQPLSGVPTATAGGPLAPAPRIAASPRPAPRLFRTPTFSPTSAATRPPLPTATPQGAEREPMPKPTAASAATPTVAAAPAPSAP